MPANNKFNVGGRIVLKTNVNDFTGGFTLI